MENNNSQTTSLWKRIEKFFGFAGFVAALAAIIGFYYQFENKNSEVKFIILSKDFLTVKNNIEGLESDYKYAGEPVKNLWLLKFKIVNSGDLTLFSSERNSSLLDSVITFNFNNHIEILNDINLVQNTFPDHKIIRTGRNKLNLYFQQWRPNESATYSIYIKSDYSNPNFLPTAKRIIKDGNIIIENLTQHTSVQKEPLIDSFFIKPVALVGRILGIILASIIFIGLSSFLMFAMFPQWIRYQKWKYKYSKAFKDFIKDYDENKLIINKYKNDLKANRKKYANHPATIEIPNIWNDWKSLGYENIPDTANTATTWKEFVIYVFVINTINICTLGTILGLWLN